MKVALENFASKCGKLLVTQSIAISTRSRDVQLGSAASYQQKHHVIGEDHLIRLEAARLDVVLIGNW